MMRSTAPQIPHFFSSQYPSSSKYLEEQLSFSIEYLVAHRPYLDQVGLSNVLSSKNPKLCALIQQYIKFHNINASNNVGMTLLHVLIWANQPDLAKMVAESPAFTKINFKFCIPSIFGGIRDTMYASAVDLAIMFWFYHDTDKTEYAELIETLLKHGALLPKPDKKFLNGEFITHIYPRIIEAMLRCDVEFTEMRMKSKFNPNAEDMSDKEKRDLRALARKSRTSNDMQDLFCMLHRYGFSINDLNKHFIHRLLESTDDFESRGAEFAAKYDVSVEDQVTILDKFMSSLLAKVKDIPSRDHTRLLSPHKLDTGERTLKLPFDPLEKANRIFR